MPSWRCSDLRKMFATSYQPSDLPNRWDIVANFTYQHSPGKPSMSPDSTQVAIENLQKLNGKAFCTDTLLTKELVTLEHGPNKLPLGVPLVSNQTKCHLCFGKLLLQNDRPSRMTHYTESLGTVPATHYHKYCHNHPIKAASLANSMDITDQVEVEKYAIITTGYVCHTFFCHRKRSLS